MRPEILTTSRLRLRSLTPEIYSEVIGNGTDEEIKAFFGIRSDEELKKERERFEKGVATFNRSFLYFHIIEKASEVVMGWCGYHTWYLDHRRAEIGYVLNDTRFMQQGIMTEAIGPVIDYGFEVMGLHRIEAFIGPDNLPSIKLVQRLGFVMEGKLRQHYCKHGKMEDSLVFSLLGEEYQNNCRTCEDGLS